MIERFNGRVAEVLKTTTFASARQLETTLQRYLHLYNQRIPQKNLGHVTPIAKLQEHYRIKPMLFQKNLSIIRDSTPTEINATEPE